MFERSTNAVNKIGGQSNLFKQLFQERFDVADIPYKMRRTREEEKAERLLIEKTKLDSEVLIPKIMIVTAGLMLAVRHSGGFLIKEHGGVHSQRVKIVVDEISNVKLNASNAKETKILLPTLFGQVLELMGQEFGLTSYTKWYRHSLRVAFDFYLWLQDGDRFIWAKPDLVTWKVREIALGNPLELNSRIVGEIDDLVTQCASRVAPVTAGCEIASKKSTTLQTVRCEGNSSVNTRAVPEDNIEKSSGGYVDEELKQM